jgi:uncharacterized lipoprotein YehR (DUF1307 family)
MKNLKTIIVIIVSFVLSLFLSVTGCDDNHGHRHIHGDRGHSPDHNERRDGDRH